jgi:two-component system, cell cycle response regulator
MPPRVLIVDDAAPIHALLRTHLPEDSFELRSVYSGEDGLRTIAKWRPDLVLLDVDLNNGIDGFEVCRQLRDDLATARLQVIFLTGSCKTEQKVYGLRLGANDYITKPFDHSEVRARIEVALRAKSRLDFLSKRRVRHFMKTR